MKTATITHHHIFFIALLITFLLIAGMSCTGQDRVNIQKSAGVHVASFDQAHGVGVMGTVGCVYKGNEVCATSSFVVIGSGLTYADPLCFSLSRRVVNGYQSSNWIGVSYSAYSMVKSNHSGVFRSAMTQKRMIGIVVSQKVVVSSDKRLLVSLKVMSAEFRSRGDLNQKKRLVTSASVSYEW